MILLLIPVAIAADAASVAWQVSRSVAREIKHLV